MSESKLPVPPKAHGRIALLNVDLRDLIVIGALQGLLANPETQLTVADVVLAANAIADEVIKVRSGK